MKTSAIEIRDWKTPVQMGLSALAVMFFFYPLLHEIGHALAAGLLGGRVIQIAIYPAFFTDCAIPTDRVFCYVATGFGGMLFPLLLSLLPRPKGPVPLAVRFSLRLMVCVSAVSELVGVTRTILGSTTETADMSVVIMRTAADPYAILILTGLLFILALVFLVMTLVLGE